MIKLCEQRFDPWIELANYQNCSANACKYGATAVFVGTMRDFNQGDGITGMYLEYYPGMTEKQLEHIVAEAHKKWCLLDSLLLHRVGEVQPNDSLVLVAAWSTHRGDAFDASRFIMESLKNQAPFWKKETLTSGQSRWVEKNSGGYQSR